MNRIAIIGAGDLGVQLAHHARTSGNFHLAGFFDDARPVGTIVAEVSVIGGTDDVEALYDSGAYDSLLIGIGYSHLAFRQKIFQRLTGKIPFATLIHPSVVVDPTCIIGEGAVLYPGCVLDAGVRIGANVLLNIGCMIAHDSEIGAGCFLSPTVKIAGFVKIDSGTTLGIGTIVIDNINIASGIRTGAGAVVTRNLVQPGLYVGVPAQFKKKLDSP